MKPRSNCAAMRGFTLVELLVFLVLASVVAGAFYQVLVFQQRIYRQEQDTVERHDALRLAGSVLATDIIEASGRGGDFAALGPDSIALRSPVGFAIVCAVDSINGTLGLIDVSGQVTAGDSLLIYRPDGWLVREARQQGSSNTSLDCPYASGPAIELTILVDSSVAGVPVGAPLRTFKTYTYRLQREGRSWWLARKDGSAAEILAGPFSGDGSGLSFAYLDSAGQATHDPARLARIDLTLVAQNPQGSGRRDTLTASLRPRNQ